MSSIKQLVQANKTGKLSTTKFWYNIACIVATLIVLHYSWDFKLTWEMFGLYLGCVGGMATASKWINMKDREERLEEPPRMD